MNRDLGQLALGVDIGGTKILTAVVDSDGNILSRDHSLTLATRGSEAVIETLLESTGRVLRQAGITSEALRIIGLGAPGLSNPETGVLFTSPNLPGWKDVPLRDIVEKELGKKTVLINDANAATVGELRLGAGRGCRHLIYITISTGIGGGVIVDGRLYTGAIGTAGELGHMTIVDGGPICNCGRPGCWEALASGTALAREAKSRVKEGDGTTILSYVSDDVTKITAEVIDKAARDGDLLARELIEQIGHYLGVGLANLINIFNPEIIVIGGGLSNIGDMLFRPAFKVAEEKAFEVPYRVVRFALAELGRNSGVLGAALYALDEVNRASLG